MKTKAELLMILNPVIEISEKMLLAGVLKKNVIKHLTNRGFTIEAANNILELAENRAEKFTHYKINGFQKINGGTYSANEIIGKTLFLKPGKTAVLYNAIGGNKTIQIKSGIVGVVYVWLVRDSGLWWEVRRGSEIWYVLHQEGLFDIKALQAQGALTTSEIIERQKEAEKNIVDKLLDKGTSLAKTALFAFFGFQLVKTLFTSNN